VFWGEGRALGPRFLFTAAPVFLLYATRFAGAIRERMTQPTWRRAVTMLVPIWMLLGWLLPAPMAQPSGVWALARRAGEQPTAMRLIDGAIADQRLDHALVFVADGWRARLIARLSALGARPFAAQKMVEHYDACMLQQLLDSAERMPDRALVRARYVFGTLDRSARAVPVPGMEMTDQISLEPGRALTPACRGELMSARSNGADYVRYLPRNRVGEDGRLSGRVVYARDYGTRNALLRERFGDRAWYRARIDRVGGVARATMEPLRH